MPFIKYAIIPKKYPNCLKFFTIMAVFIFTSFVKEACTTEISLPVWVTSDSVKIFKDTPRQNENIVWSAKTNTIELSGARNEIVSCQIVINGLEKGLQEVTVIPSDLKDAKSGNTISINNFNLFLEWYTLSPENNKSNTKKYYPDALIPFYNPYGTDRFVVAAFFDINPQENQPVWIDIYIPKGKTPGKYKGELDIISRGKTINKINLNFTVLPFTIPDERHLTAYSDMYGGKIAGLEGLGYDTEENWNTLKEYWIMARKHRFDFNSQGYELKPNSSLWDPAGFYRTDANTWLKYDNYLGQVITGEIFPDRLPPNIWRLPFPEAKYSNMFGINCKYLHKDTWEKPQGCYDNDYQTWENKISSLARTIQEHFLIKELSGEWPKGTLEKSFLYIIDEPKQLGYHYPYIKDYSNLIRKSAPKLKFMLTEQPEEPLFGYVDIWSPSASALAPQRIDDCHKRGEKVWFYQSGEPYIGSQLLTADAIAMRMWAWTAWKYNIDGVFLWANNYWTSQNPYTDPQVDEGGKPTNSYGDGYIFYPGKMLSFIGFSDIDGPVSSIRMKMWRRGFLDYEYLQLAKESGKENEAHKIVASLVKNALVDNYKEINDPLTCAKKKFDGQQAKIINGKCTGTCPDYTNKSCWHNDGILIGPWDCDDGPNESGKYPQWWEDSRAKQKSVGWSKNPDDWVRARYALAKLINEDSLTLTDKQNEEKQNIVYLRKNNETRDKDLEELVNALEKNNNQVMEIFSDPIEAKEGMSFGKNGLLTFELHRGGTFLIDGKSNLAWQKSDHYGDVAIIRTTNPLPKTYKISVIVGDIAYGLENISGLKSDSQYKEGPLNENGAYLIAIADDNPSGHHTNDWWHQHRKVVIDVDNNIWGAGMPNPIFMVYFDKENKLVSHNKNDQWEYKWDAAVNYKTKSWYKIEIEKTAESYRLLIYDIKGKLLNGGIVPLRRVWHTEDNYPDYFVIGDPHENYYQGSMKIKAISIQDTSK